MKPTADTPSREDAQPRPISADEPQVDEPVEVVPADARWPEWFQTEHQRLRTHLPDGVEIEHFGSTAVPGLDAKPIVDILVGVADDHARDAVAHALQPLGYELLGEAGVPGRLYLRYRGERCYNISVVARRGDVWRDNLALRDYLRAHREARRAYADAKRATLRAGHRTLLDYSDAKAPTVQELVARARDHQRQRGGHSSEP